MDREPLLRRRRELYRQCIRETPDEKEVRLSGRREYYRQLAYPESRAHNFYPSCMHACILRLAPRCCQHLSTNSYLFSLHTLQGLECCTLNYNYYMFPLYLSHFSTDVNTTYTTIYPMHALQVHQYSDLMLSLKITTESTLHSRVKHSITHSSLSFFIKFQRKTVISMPNMILQFYAKLLFFYGLC